MSESALASAAEFASTVASWTGAVAGLVTAGAAIWAAATAVRTLKAAKSDSRERSRPMVGVQLAPTTGPGRRHSSLVVENFGPTVAYDLKVSFEPPLEDSGTHSGKNSVIPYIIRRYSRPIPNLMPGVRLSNIIFVSRDGAGPTVENDEMIADTLTVTVECKASTDDDVTYSDVFVLDNKVLREETYLTASNDEQSLRERGTKALEAMAPAVKSASAGISKLESHLKPDSVRVNEAAEREESRRHLSELEGVFTPQTGDE